MVARRKSLTERPGEPIYKGHQSYDLMLTLQLGIRYSVGRVTPMPLPDKLPDMSTDQKVKVEFPRAGSQITPQHRSTDFLWKDYAPLTFRKLREIFEIDASEFMLSLCGDQALRVLDSPGKSGSVFYFSHDGRYLVKTMRKEEMRTLLAMLPKYYKHIHSNPHTLLTKFYGLYRISWKRGRKVRMLVMGNLLQTDLTMHLRFDLKGSTVGRRTEGPRTNTTTLKDLDLGATFQLEECRRDEFVQQIHRDSEFLEESSIMDYSMLLGVHYVDCSRPQAPIPAQVQNVAAVMVSSASDNGNGNGNGAEGGEGEHSGPKEVVLLAGIIDILQSWDYRKKFENTFKSLYEDSSGISAVKPKQYAQRFRDYMDSIFL